MSILWRSWLTFSVVMATVLAILASLSILQHNAILSDLTRGRIAVVAHTTAVAFRAITDLGLPLSAMRNGDEIVARAHDVGVLAAQQVLRIREGGAVPGDLPIAQVTDFAYVVNMRVARDLGRFPPFAFMQIAEVTE